MLVKSSLGNNAIKLHRSKGSSLRWKSRVEETKVEAWRWISLGLETVIFCIGSCSGNFAFCTSKNSCIHKIDKTGKKSDFSNVLVCQNAVWVVDILGKPIKF